MCPTLGPWKSLLANFHNVTTLGVFKNNFKMFLFRSAFKNYFLFNIVFNTYIFILLSAMDQHNYVNSPIKL